MIDSVIILTVPYDFNVFSRTDGSSTTFTKTPQVNLFTHISEVL